MPDEKIHAVARIAGYVYMGFLHPGDMAEELKEETNLDLKTCNAISAALDARVFAPLRSDIDKIYQPLSGGFAAGPKIIQDIGPAPMVPAPTSTRPMPVVPAIPLKSPASPPTSAAPTAPAPVSKLSETGWSKLTPESPVARISQTSAPPMPAVAAKPIVPPPSAAPQKPAEPLARPGIDEFERLRMQAEQKARGAPAPAPVGAPAASQAATPQGPQSSQGPAPLIIHEDASFKTQQKAPDFHVPVPPEQFSMKKPPSSPMVKPAVLELGGANAAPPAAVAAAAPKIPSTPRVVHYTEYKPPVGGSRIPAPQGPRQITEVTASFKPPVPPTPPASPKPATPPKPPGK